MKRYKNPSLIIGKGSELSSIRNLKGGSFYAEDTNQLYVSDGSTFNNVTAAVTGTIEAIDLESYSPNKDGSTDDTATLQQAIDAVIASTTINKLYIGPGSYKVDGELDIDGEIEIIGNGATLVIDTAVAQFSLFTKTTDTNLTIKNLNVDATGATSVNGVKFLDVQGSFTNSDIVIDKCSFLTYDDEVNNAFVYIEEALAGNSLTINNCTTDDCVFFYFDTNADAYLQKLIVTNNTATNCPRWFLRSQSFSPATSGYVVIDAWVENNTVTDINGTLVDTSQVARVVQVEIRDNLYVRNNIFDTSTTTSSGNAVYISKGNLVFENNIVKDLQGADNTAIIDDKGENVTTERWIIRNNVFDQSGLTHADDVGQAIIRILAQQNVVISGNTCIGLKTMFVFIYQSINNGQWADNITIESNMIYDIDYPVVISLIQESTNVRIINNTVKGHTNSQSISGANAGGLTHRRLFSVYQTFNNSGEGVKNLFVSGNIHSGVDQRQYLGSLYINAVAPTANIDSIFVTNNQMYGTPTGGSAIMYFVDATGSLVNNQTNVVVANNVTTVSGMTEDQGIRPADVTQQNNIFA